jgi:hypothetical protein
MPVKDKKKTIKKKDISDNTLDAMWGALPHRRGKVNEKTGAIIIDKETPDAYREWALNG